MCGIVGYIGKRPAQEVLLAGLKHLEYRGYDSSGIAVIMDGKNSPSIRKSPGKISALEKLLKGRALAGSVGIAHTRWATHGQPNQRNAHPHPDCAQEIAVVHNGIIENFEELKLQLVKEKHAFRSQTDTEVIAHLIEKFYDGVPLEEAVRKALNLLSGSFAIAVVARKEPRKLVGARMGSPLILGIGKGEYYLASDAPAILDYTRDIVFLEEGQIAVLTDGGYEVTDFNGRSAEAQPVRINWNISANKKQGYRHFMLKEINEQPGIIDGLLKLRIREDGQIHFSELGLAEGRLRQVKNIAIVACGTAYHAGLVGKYILEPVCGLPVSVEVSSEFRYHKLLIDESTLVIAISQSGETADTLACVREAKKHKSPVLAVCNVLGSTITRESDGVIYTHAGPEIGVASTKAYTAQLVALYLLAFHLARLRGKLSAQGLKRHLGHLQQIPALQERVLKAQEKIAVLARRHSHYGSFLYLGRNLNYPSALEGALKLKEVSYIPAEGYAAGEMKHGPIALIDEYRAVVCVAPDSATYSKMVSNIQEILSRQGKIIAVVSEGNRAIREIVGEVVYVPKTDEFFSPLLTIIPLQLLAYHIALKRGCDVDQPRNLAKSVTVE